MIKLKSIIKEIYDTNLLEGDLQVIVYTDMDGVLCNFDKQFEKITGTPTKEYEAKYGTDKFWDEIIKEGSEFWSTMDEMPNFDYYKKELLQLSTDGRFKVKVLTSTSADKILRTHPKEEAVNFIRDIEFGKKQWIKQHWNNPIPIIFSGSGRGKSKYATPNSILIDDLTPNVEAFIASGGSAIIYTDAHQAIDELKAKIKI